jgi:5-methylcytosine-specific restriction enzyme A
MSCQLCGRDAATTEHHLVPKERKKKEKFGSTTNLCDDCHRMLHATFDNKRLARTYNTIEAIRQAPELQAFLKWIKKQPSCTYFGSKTRIR